ncbi:hypothetical protein, variant 1 [Aphanomyces invadans]|uniref:Peroxisomal ATPase PEX1 n=1 Tax=Aphanomyces invadans TaxID=157072 RepID=A0A024UA50_9STRA|nr:hypothetical protein, variant 1 [Aphanomyces invadans]ETW02468.1 hypothetical protein, variant 1 [Aphanomyces invadans]|eukprot:XP_008869073.1 hypothetical protein, variant 1 [Aphanomyces invadans]
MHTAAEGAAFVTVRFVPICSCFVSLPESFVRDHLQHVNPNLGATILRLTWPRGAFMETAYVGWVGGITQSPDMELSLEFSRCVHLADALDVMPGLRISVSVVPSIAVAPSIEMEPASPDDWEIIQLHAGYLESEILRQVCVVQQNQEVPIRIQEHVVIHLFTRLPSDIPFARLSSNSEVYITPKLRPATDVDAHSAVQPPSPVLKVQPSVSYLSNGNPVDLNTEQGEILVHPMLIATLGGARHSLLVASLWDDSADPETRLSCVGRVRESTDIAFDFCGVSTNIQRVLGLTWLSHVRIRLLTHAPLLPLRVHVTSLTPAITDIDRFLAWSRSVGPSVLCRRTLVTVEENLQLIVTAQFLNTEDSSTAPNTLRDDYVIVGDGFYAPRTTDISLQPCTPQDSQVLTAVDPNPHATLVQLPGMEHIVTALWKRIFPTLGRDGCAMRTRMGVGPPGSIILHGPRGSGKTSVLSALQSKCALSFGVMCRTVAVSCRDLRGLKMDTVKETLTEAFDQAMHMAPCLLTLDDIDALMPPEDDAIAGMSEQSRRLAEHLADLIKKSRHAMHQHATTLSQVDSTTCKAKWPVFAAACSKKTVAVVATAREAQSMHPLLRTCGLFDRPIPLPLPDVVARENILRGLVKGAAHEPADDQFQLVALKTEGFSARDLNQVVDRAVHQATIHARHASGADNPLDLMAGLQDFTPAALRGVELFKSSVLWSDIGGLKDIRQMLKDTLELPTKYGKLYAAAPIKLPSGLLLFGPPGCGKTLLANAVANECGLNFISVKGPEVLNKYIGASEQAVRDLFSRAAAAAPSVLFLDEFDAMAPRRGADNTGVTDRVVNQLLTFLDGVESRQGVYVLAATSRPDMIDPALLRPGRLDKSLYCGFPEAEDRLDILRAVARKMDLADDVLLLLPSIAQHTELYSGADLQAVMYAAQLEAVHAAIPSVDDDWDVEFKDTGDSVSFSPKTPRSSQIRTWHVKKALAASRPSVSLEAKQRYDRMYGSFKNTSQPRVTDFKTADSFVALDSKTAHPIQRSALF